MATVASKVRKGDREKYQWDSKGIVKKTMVKSKGGRKKVSVPLGGMQIKDVLFCYLLGGVVGLVSEQHKLIQRASADMSPPAMYGGAWTLGMFKMFVVSRC